MPQYLVDSNTYLRLARTVQGLLGDHGDLELRVLPKFDLEYLRSARLKTKFTWPGEPPHPASRTKWSLKVTSSQAKQVEGSRTTVSEFAEELLKDDFGSRSKPEATRQVLSPQDLSLLCHAIVLKIGIATDERPLTKAAKTYGVPVLSSLAVLRHLLGQKVVTMEKVEAIVNYWQYDRDTPYAGWEAEYKKRFKKAPPKP